MVQQSIVSEEAPQKSTVEKIRAATRPQHEIMDNSNQYILEESYTMGEYRRLLRRVYGLHAALEKQFDRIGQQAEWQEVGIDLEERKKLALLEQDLKALGESEEEIRKLESSREVEELVTTIPQLLGALYVIEGSTLGGQFIAHKLEHNLKIDVEHGGSYYRSYGKQTKAMWRQLCEKISAFGERHLEAEEEMMRTASAMFVAYDRFVFVPTRPVA